jgi:ADP-ribosylglycohydrolase
VFDVGITTTRAIQAICAGTPPLQCGPSGERDNGNGSLMRVLPLVLWHRGSDEELIDLAHRQSLVTHGHARSQVACALYCLWARSVLREDDAPWSAAIAQLRATYGRTEHGLELRQHFALDDWPDISGEGYVVDALWSARWAMKQGSYERVVRAAVSLGNDTDTTACIAGGIAGLRDGVDEIPQRWRESLRGQELLQPLLERLRAWRQSG